MRASRRMKESSSFPSAKCRDHFPELGPALVSLGWVSLRSEIGRGLAVPVQAVLAAVPLGVEWSIRLASGYPTGKCVHQKFCLGMEKRHTQAAAATAVSSSRFTISITSQGQYFAHSLHPMHTSSSTITMPLTFAWVLSLGFSGPGTL